MATAAELIAKVQDLYVDGSYSDDEVLGFLNEGLQVVAFAEDVFLPSLDASDDVSTVTGTDVADLPADCTEGFYAAYVGERELKVHESWSKMKRALAMVSHAGPVADVAAKNGKLMYFPVPDPAETITIFYYRAPAPMATVDPVEGEPEEGETPVEDNGPDCFTIKTRAVGESALVAYAMARVYESIEEGIDERKINTIYWERQFDRAMIRLRSMIRSGVSSPQPQRNARW